MFSCIVILFFRCQTHIIEIDRTVLQDILQYADQSGREEWNMTWILLAFLVGVVFLSVHDQLNREREAASWNTLAREYSL